MLALPGLVNIHCHPTTEPGYRGVREDHGVPEQQMTGLIERLQAFRLGDDGRSAAAELAYAEMLRAGTTTACDVTVPFEGWLDTMAQQRHALLRGADLRLGALGHERAADRDLEMGRGARPGGLRAGQGASWTTPRRTIRGGWPAWSSRPRSTR